MKNKIELNDLENSELLDLAKSIITELGERNALLALRELNNELTEAIGELRDYLKWAKEG
jgi:hypothetical protein